MIKYLTDNELVERERMYFDAQTRVLHYNLGKALNELHSLNNVLSPVLPDVKNMIEHAAEKIFHCLRRGAALLRRREPLRGFVRIL